MAYGLGAPLLAALTNRWSRTRVLVIALFGFCLANVGSALAPTALAESSGKRDRFRVAGVYLVTRGRGYQLLEHPQIQRILAR